MGKKWLFIIVLVGLILGGVWAYNTYYLSDRVSTLADLPACDYYLVEYPEIVEMINKACEVETRVSDAEPTEDEPGRVNYLNAALAWKSAGDALPLEQRDDLYRRALNVYLLYERKFNDQAYALRWNIAHLYQDLGDYQSSEAYYLKAIESNNINSEPYLALYFLYDKGYITKSTAEIDHYFVNALNFVSENRDQLLDRYLKFLEKNNMPDKAKEIRAELKVRYPDLY